MDGCNVTVIPKNSAPAELGELRNLSCTPLFLKILESFILDRLKRRSSLAADNLGVSRDVGQSISC